MNAENTTAQMRKGILEYCILMILFQKEAYPSEIITELKEAKMIVAEGTLYPLLTRLKNAGLLNYKWVESVSGPPRKYYTLTPEGILFLDELKPLGKNYNKLSQKFPITTIKITIMNKTISINISGIVFNIEEQAYDELRAYIENIRQNLINEEEREEIINDIEMRIAELFQERLSPQKQVITMDDIAAIKSILGLPEQFNSTDENTPPSPEDEKTEKSTDNTRRLYRDMDQASLGGVCAGLGHYFELDPLIFRILFIVLFLLFGAGVLLYIVLLLLIPEAKTTADKITMRGQPVNADSIKEFIASIKNKVSETDTTKLKKTLNSAVENGVKTSKSIIAVFSKLIGFSFLIGGLVLTTFILVLLFGDTGLIPFLGPDHIPDFVTLVDVTFPDQTFGFLIVPLILIVIILPIISIIGTGLRLIFEFKIKLKAISIALVIIWTVAASILFIFAIGLGSDVKDRAAVTQTLYMQTDSTNTLEIEIANDDQFSNHLDLTDNISRYELIKTDSNFIYFGLVNLKVQSLLYSDSVKIDIIRKSRGSSDQDAIENIENMQFTPQIVGNKLIIPPYLKVPRMDKIRGQAVDILITLPIGKNVKFVKNSKRIRKNVNLYDSEEFEVFD
jgi:DNA-binding PadR family transcriptional regulator/phage shock protein PspC (stress-responsive transcriptional regulator)